jgi:hypothetical protein
MSAGERRAVTPPNVDAGGWTFGELSLGNERSGRWQS